ncbi:MAG: cytochrome c-type biogenesis protein CcmH [Pseudoxanthomonas sp.]
MNRTRARNPVLPALVLLLLLALPAISFAQSGNPALPQFRDAAEETRFHQLTGELRCVMCQNQSLADSDAQIAHDLRREVLELMHQGRTDRQIKDFLVERYGEFVLYEPPMDKHTWLLWFGPFALVLLGAGIMLRVLRRQPRSNDVPTDDTQEW